MNEIVKFSEELVDFSSDFDPYDFMDTVEDPEELKASVAADLLLGKPDAYQNFLTEIVEDNRDEAATKMAKALLDKLEELLTKGDRRSAHD